MVRCKLGCVKYIYTIFCLGVISVIVISVCIHNKSWTKFPSIAEYSKIPGNELSDYYLRKKLFDEYVVNIGTASIEVLPARSILMDPVSRNYPPFPDNIEYADFLLGTNAPTLLCDLPSDISMQEIAITEYLLTYYLKRMSEPHNLSVDVNKAIHENALGCIARLREYGDIHAITLFEKALQHSDLQFWAADAILWNDFNNSNQKEFLGIIQTKWSSVRRRDRALAFATAMLDIALFSNNRDSILKKMRLQYLNCFASEYKNYHYWETISDINIFITRADFLKFIIKAPRKNKYGAFLFGAQLRTLLFKIVTNKNIASPIRRMAADSIFTLNNSVANQQLLMEKLLTVGCSTSNMVLDANYCSKLLFTYQTMTYYKTAHSGKAKSMSQK